MKIVLATGIYPPDIGGPATYAYQLAKELTDRQHQVTVVTYRHTSKSQIPITKFQINPKSQSPNSNVVVVSVSKTIPILRWMLYAMALWKCAKDADIVYAFSSVSSGVPLILARLRKPKKILRLGGDFFWERYTAMVGDPECSRRSGMMSLKEWYESVHWTLILSHRLMHWILNRFDHIVFSTRFQEEIYEDFYQSIPGHSVIENPLADMRHQTVKVRKSHTPFRLLFMGRFVGFKNLFTLLDAVQEMPWVMITLLGDGPFKKNILARIARDHMDDRVIVLNAVYGEEKVAVFREHDVLIIPSTTEISPNTALEARSAGLPVLLTTETGLSAELQKSMVIRPLRTKEDIQRGVQEVKNGYEDVVRKMMQGASTYGWGNVVDEHINLFQNILI